MKTKYYIAYGSNMDEGQMAIRCPQARLIGKSEVNDYELLFKGSKSGAYATIEPKQGSKVPVLIWKITPADEFSLDRYEGYPNFYYKKDLEVSVNGKPIKAMVYIMDEKREMAVPSDRYFGVLERAYLKFGFEYSKLEKAYEKCLGVVYDD